jgi:hypothetical protein
VSFSKIADSRLVFRSLLQPTEEILTEEDIEEVVAELTSPESEEAADTETPAGPTETPTAEGTAAETVGTAEEAAEATQGVSYRLTDERKKQLFLRYVNRLLDLVFR